MRKQRIVETTKTVTVCDLCERDASNGFSDYCFFCHREVCLTCRTLLFCNPSGGDWLLEFPIKVCLRCRYDDLEKLVAEAMLDVNKKLRTVVDLWRRRAKE